MFSRLLKPFRPVFYVQIWEKRVRVTDVTSGEVINEKPQLLIDTNNNQVTGHGKSAQVTGSHMKLVNPFSHPRTLLADFNLAEKLLSLLFEQINRKRWIKISPIAVMHPMEKLEGGLTQIENRVLRELAIGAGARIAAVYEGKEMPLDDLTIETIEAMAINNA